MLAFKRFPMSAFAPHVSKNCFVRISYWYSDCIHWNRMSIDSILHLNWFFNRTVSVWRDIKRVFGRLIAFKSFLLITIPEILAKVLPYQLFLSILSTYLVVEIKKIINNWSRNRQILGKIMFYYSIFCLCVLQYIMSVYTYISSNSLHFQSNYLSKF